MKGRKEKRRQSHSSQASGEFERIVESAMDDDSDLYTRNGRGPTINAIQDQVDKDSSCFSYLSAVVTECLDLHEQCTGSYIDSSGKYILRCCCVCHTKDNFKFSITKTRLAPSSHGG